MLRVVDGAYLHHVRWRASDPEEPVCCALYGLIGARNDLEGVILPAYRVEEQKGVENP